MYLPLASSLLIATCLAARGALIINEIMYHPSSENPAEEYIELYNSGPSAVSLNGWKFTNGVEFTFPNVSIPAGQYLVIAANQAAFQAKYPAVTAYVAGWTGQLSNSSNKIVLENNLGTTIDEVDYADDGDWATRRKDPVLDFGHRGWDWTSGADGGGKSLELVKALFANTYAQNWMASTSTNGTPGAANSVASGDIAPVILDPAHYPLVPKSTDSVVITTKVLNDDASTPAVTLHWKLDTAGSWNSLPMFDDGAHSDGLAGDGTFGATILPQTNNAIVEFYFEAMDGGNHRRFWPEPALNESGVLLVDGTGQPTSSPHALYQVDNTVNAGAAPIYRLVMKMAERDELTQINTDTPLINGVDQTFSHAKMNTTFISMDGTGSELRYLCGVRNRGHGSRGSQPQSLNLTIPADHKWNGITSLNFNSQYTYLQLFGSALARKAGLPAPESRQIQLRVNNADPTGGDTGGPSYGFYVANEVQNSDFAEHHFPLDSSGNIYSVRRMEDDPYQEGFLDYLPPAGLNGADPYRPVYFKQTNASEDDWSDLIGLTQALAKGHKTTITATPTWDADYVTAVRAKVDVEEWMRWFAVETLFANNETNFARGYGDDYYLYFGVNDPLARLIPYDLDTILGHGDNQADPDVSIFRMVMHASSQIGQLPTPLLPFLRHPSFAPLYFAALKEQLDGPMSVANFNAFADQILTGVMDAARINALKTWYAQRHAYVSSQIPLALSVTSTPAVDVTSGFPKTTSATCNLSGLANPITTRSVKVNGAAATYHPFRITDTITVPDDDVVAVVGEWTITGVVLRPGVNRLLIQAFDAANTETDRIYQNVWYDDGSVANLSGAIAANTTWTAAGGPYQVTSTLTVNSGATLTIQPGASVYLATGANLIVATGGRLLAEGTETQPIRFSRAPGASGNWGNLQINGGAGSPETRIAYTHFEFNGGSPAVRCTNATVYLDHLTFGNTAVSYLHLDSSSFVVSNCIFPKATTAFEGVHGTGGVKSGGYGIIRDCFFGKMNGYNDVVDFTGGQRPGPILQVINNVFMGSDDDILDLDGADTWIEGNIFLHVHRNGSPDSASAISGGKNQGSPEVARITAIGNLFYDVDQAATAKQGNFYVLLNNTIVHQTHVGSQDAFTALLNLTDFEAGGPGAGLYLEGNIVHDAEALVRNYDPALSTVTFNNNILPFAWTGPGGGNAVADPRLKHLPTLAETNFATFQAAQIMRDWLSLLPSSPALGTGPNGRDKGGVVPLGASISGEPSGTTNQNTATLAVGDNRTGNGIPSAGFPNGSGFTHYKWKLDAGAFSAETPISTPISLSGLAPGSHSVSVIGKNDAGFYQNDPAFGGDATITISRTWIVDPNYVPPSPTPNVRINEVLAKNSDTQGFGGVFPDIVELYNAGGATADLAGWGLTDNSALPYKYTFPPGTFLAPGAYLVVYADSSASVPQPRTGFALKQSGDTLTLSKSAAAGGGIADSVPFGAQLADLSVGRRATDGAWDLCRPTFGSVNVVAAQGTLVQLKINEWLADAQTLASTDFIELYNPGTQPVNVGGGYLTDNPVEWPTRHQIRQLTILGPSGYAAFKADGDTNQGPDHLDFKLDPLQGEIGFFDAVQVLIDNIVYGPQSTDVSEGRTPNGSATIVFFNQPTPGAPNPGTAGGTTTTTVNVFPATHGWRYYQSSTAAPPNDSSARTFINPAYNDTQSGLGWLPASGNAGQVLYIESSGLPANGLAEGFAKTTLLTGYNATHPYQTYYFRTHFTYSGSLTSVTLNANVFCDDGAVIYLNGFEAGRIRVTDNPVLYSTEASMSSDVTMETVPIDAAHLQVGDNVLSVSVHQSDTQSASGGSSDITWGMKLDANVTSPVGGSPVVLNEVLSRNATLQNPNGSFTGWVELYNPSASVADVSDMSLTNEVGVPRKWVFASGTTIPANGYLDIYCDGAAPVSATNTGFALDGGGDEMFLFEKLTLGGGLHDSVVFGRQLADRSIGRIPNGGGAWTLNVASRGALNSAAGLGLISNVKVNEWMARPAFNGPDWFELYNSGAQAVLLSGNYLTHNLTDRTRYLLPPLTFLGAGADAWWRLDADNTQGALNGHVNFTLNETSGAIGLFSGGGVQLEAVSFGSQAFNISSGRYPDGSATIRTFPETPTPGAMNVVLVDTDNDGLADVWEMAHFGNLAQIASGDADGDGDSNLDEYRAGTDPKNPADVLRCDVVKVAGAIVVRFAAAPNKSYTVQFKNALSDPSWQKLADIPPDLAPRNIEVSDPSGANQPTRFYRAVTPVQP